MSKFIIGVSDLVVKECRTIILAQLITHSQKIGVEKLKEREG